MDTKELTFEQKIEMLKQKHRKSHPDAIAAINNWEEKYAYLKEQKEWLKHPMTQELFKLAVEQVSAIESILIDTETLTDDERRRLYAEKKAHKVYISALLLKPEDQLNSLESSVESELN